MATTDLTENDATLLLFDSVYDQYADFCRKLRFLIRGAFSMEDETLAIEIISQFLERKEKELYKLETAARERIAGRTGDRDSFERLLGRLLMEREDYRILLRIAHIRRSGGPRWEMLQTILSDQGDESEAVKNE
ncbi:MAG: hypothetical protein P4L43_16025 [Syntrophobacteraceae bacterium]|nr:hypothetical protein [Syntrophobacteraceae bacterium]